MESFFLNFLKKKNLQVESAKMPTYMHKHKCIKFLLIVIFVGRECLRNVARYSFSFGCAAKRKERWKEGKKNQPPRDALRRS